MASSSGSSIVPAFLLNNRSSTGGISRRHWTQLLAPAPEGGRNLALLWKGKRKKRSSFVVFSKQRHENALHYRKLGDSDLVISEITLGTMTYGEQNTEKEAHEQLSYAFERGINALDTAEVVCDELVIDILEYPVPLKKETQGRTDQYIASWLKSQPRDKVILATKVAGYSERSSYLRDNSNVVRVDAANIKESVEKSLKRLNTDYIDLLQIHWPDRYVALFGEYFYDPSRWRSSVSFVEQLRGFQELIDQGKVRYIGVSNETSYGVMEFVHAAPGMLASNLRLVQDKDCQYSTIVCWLGASSNLISLKCATQTTATLVYLLILHLRVEHYLGNTYVYELLVSISCLLWYSQLEVTAKYLEVAKKHGRSLVELALGFARDQPFVTSSIIGATTMDQLKEDIDAF
ncbi:UNVERIFIED_CONTAM: protein tas [Sesamum radiatum]|uniref:Protein tas n=1 Tax=Sesamum radiatum TaxID=300843 RepID=A0AAW2QGB3_SESRA